MKRMVNDSPAATALRTARNAMLQLHKTLLDNEKANFEREHGQIRNANEYLRLVMNDAAFEWLRVLSQLIVTIDEAFAAKREPLTDDAVRALAGQTRELLLIGDATNEFARKYTLALENSPQARLDHTAVANALEGVK